MNILGIETSSVGGSVALKLGTHIEQQSLGPSRQQAGQILPIIAQLLSRHSLDVYDLDLLTFSAGPGSFTGVRMGLGVVQGLALAANLAVIPISSLQVLAQSAYRLEHCTHVFCLVDAFMGEIYSGTYQLDTAGIMFPITEDHLSKPENLLFPASGSWTGIGSGWESYRAQLAQNEQISAINGILQPQAQDLVLLAENMLDKKLSIDDVLPYYLRDKDAWKKTNI